MSFENLKHAQRERLTFLDQCFTWKGRANRRDLVERFGVSPAQAALDFKAYLAAARGRAPRYDRVKKVYLASSNYDPLAPETAFEDWESVLRNSGSEHFDELPSLSRRYAPSIMAALSRAMESQNAIEVCYTSMNTGDQTPQWIAPTRFASDGSRIHVRAFSYRHGDYRDYVPGRIDPLSTFTTRALDKPLPFDRDWHTIARITLRPRSGLSEEQAAAVRREYGFKENSLIVETRKALEFYADRHWGLDQPQARLEREKTEYFDSVKTLLNTEQP